jgi:hypothetical protein
MEAQKKDRSISWPRKAIRDAVVSKLKPIIEINIARGLTDHVERAAVDVDVVVHRHKRGIEGVGLSQSLDTGSSNSAMLFRFSMGAHFAASPRPNSWTDMNNASLSVRMAWTAAATSLGVDRR